MTYKLRSSTFDIPPPWKIQVSRTERPLGGGGGGLGNSK